MDDGLVWDENSRKYVYRDSIEIPEDSIPSPTAVRKAQHAPEHVGSGYPVIGRIYTTSS